MLRAAPLLVWVAALFLVTPFIHAQQATEPKRVLVLYWDNKDFPSNALFDKSFQARLSLANEPVEYYPEYLESNRFPGENQSLYLRDFLRQKYAGRKIDVVVATADPTMEFLRKYRADVFANAPIVSIAVTRPTAAEVTTGPGITGLIRSSTHRQTLDLALRLLPDTEQVYAISGTPSRDKRYELAARSALEGYGRVKINYLTDLPLNELLEQTKSLPKRSIIFWLWQQSQDEQGKILTSPEVLALVSKSAHVPIYAMNSGYVEAGIVGGYVVSPETYGARMAELVLQILKGTRAQDIPIENAPAGPMLDWRQLQRWQINEKSLPPGSVVLFKEYTFWEKYRWRIVGIIIVFILQSLFIATLLFERVRRRQSKELLDQLNAELEQRIAARTAALDAKSRELETFAYSVAHDLKAPLRGIDGYTRLLLADHAASLNDEGRNFLKTIHTSSEEMNQLIGDLLDYSRLERRELKSNRIELRSLVNAVVEQKEREVTEHGIHVQVSVNGGVVLADVNGLAQALRNYLDNAINFTREVAEPRIEVGSEESENSCVLWVRDNGIGFDMKYRDRIFEIFQRLNHSEEYPGTGIGLAIVRKAMERMGGRAWGESSPGQGATFFLEIPKTSS